jgi:hypothetical protein
VGRRGFDAGRGATQRLWQRSTRIGDIKQRRGRHEFASGRFAIVLPGLAVAT